MNSVSKKAFHSGLVWTASGVVLTVYGILGLLNTNIPGVEELVNFSSSAEGYYIYIAAFLTMFAEGLYIIGNLVPGATLVIVIAILSQTSGIETFILTIVSIFFGWCTAGIVNVMLAKFYRHQTTKTTDDPEYRIESRLWTTWFPAFRANYEVAQVTEGGSPLKVFVSSLHVRFWASLAVAITALVAPFVIDIKDISNEEGFISIAIVAVICFWVGIVKTRENKSQI